MRRDLPAKLYDGDAELAGDGPIPGASAQSRSAIQFNQALRFQPEWAIDFT